MAQYDINLREYWRILKKRKAIVVFTAIVLGFFSTSFSILRAPTPIYTSVCSIKFDKETEVEGLFAKTISWSGSDDMETQISIINSYSVFEKVAQKLGLIPMRDIKEGHLKSNIIRIVMDLQSKVEVTREKFTNILNIKVEDQNPSFAQKLANTIALTYKELHSERQMKRTIEALKYIKEQLEDVQQKLRKSEDAFNRFSQDNQLISIDLQSDNLLTGSQKTQDEMRKIQKYRMELESISERLKQFIENPSSSNNDFYSEKINSRYQAASANLMELLLKKDTLLEEYTPQHPEVIGIGRKIIENARKMLILLRVEIRDADIREIDLLNELRSIRKKTDLLMEKKIEFDRRKRRVEYYRKMTALLEEKNQEALIRKAEKPEEITIVRPALLPTVPVNPPRTATTGTIGFIVGIVLGLVMALVVETFDTSLGAIEDVEQTIGSPVLGVIPHVDQKQILVSLKEKFPDGAEDLSSIIRSPHIISHFAPMSVIAESFRALRTSIQFKEAENPIKSIVITSASPQEGKTFVSINFSITMAQAGMKVLLVGADMRKPMLSKAFGLESTPGLSDILLGSYKWRDGVKTITDIIMGKIGLDGAMITPGLDNLHIISAGAIPPNPAELIESKGIGEFVQQAASFYDIIIFDAPPILSTADAAIIATKMDSVLLVYRVGSVSRGLLKRSVTQLEQAKSHILGVVLNGMRPEISPDFDDFRYYKYDYAYSSKGEDKKQRKSLLFRPERSRKGEEITDEALAKGAVMGQEKQKTGNWKLPFGIAALFLLVSGILWQSGVIVPPTSPEIEKAGEKEDVEPALKKRPTPTSSLKRQSDGLKKGASVKSKGPLSKREGISTRKEPRNRAKKTVPNVKTAAGGEGDSIESERGYTRERPDGTSAKKVDMENRKDDRNVAGRSVLRAGSASERNDGIKKDNKGARKRPESSSLKSIAARFWRRTVRDIKTSISIGKSQPQSKDIVAVYEKRVSKEPERATPNKGLEKKGLKHKANGPDTKRRRGAQSTVTEGQGKDHPDQPGTSASERVASKPREKEGEENKTVITRVNAASTWPSIDENEEFLQARPIRSFPKLIRAKTIKYRIKGSSMAVPQDGVISTWPGINENEAEFVWAVPKTSLPPLIRARTIKYRHREKSMAFQQNYTTSESKAPILSAQLPLAPPIPEEPGREKDIVKGPTDNKSDYPYSLYLGSFRTEERAQKAIAYYRKDGFSPYRAKVEFREKGLWYRVYGGYFQDAAEAEGFKKTYELIDAEVRKTNYANLVGVYGNQKKLTEMISRLEGMGYSPYVIKGSKGESRLFLGAYITRTGAEQQTQDLKSKGIPVQVIRR